MRPQEMRGCADPAAVRMRFPALPLQSAEKKRKYDTKICERVKLILGVGLKTSR